ncbi:MAG: hypothetical protein ACFFF9_07770 [Candidatus Thorarchaeota archaeon]
MNVDNALAKFSIFMKMLDGGDTGKRGAKHRGFLQLWFTHNLRSRSYTTGACIFELETGQGITSRIRFELE